MISEETFSQIFLQVTLLQDCYFQKRPKRIKRTGIKNETKSLTGAETE